jgi:hypothetical protein
MKRGHDYVDILVGQVAGRYLQYDNLNYYFKVSNIYLEQNIFDRKNSGIIL